MNCNDLIFFFQTFFYLFFAVSSKVNWLLIWAKLDSIFDILLLSSSLSLSSLCSILFLSSSCWVSLIIFDGIREQRPPRTEQNCVHSKCFVSSPDFLELISTKLPVFGSTRILYSDNKSLNILMRDRANHLIMNGQLIWKKINKSIFLNKYIL